MVLSSYCKYFCPKYYKTVHLTLSISPVFQPCSKLRTENWHHLSTDFKFSKLTNSFISAVSSKYQLKMIFVPHCSGPVTVMD